MATEDNKRLNCANIYGDFVQIFKNDHSHVHATKWWGKGILTVLAAPILMPQEVGLAVVPVSTIIAPFTTAAA